MTQAMIVIERAVAVPTEQQLPNEYEVDSVEDSDFGPLYRLWKGWNLLGSFYQALDGKWVAQPSLITCEERFDTALIAQQAIIDRSGMLI
ncbi:hypothetical protein NIES4071_109190 (plasmid) [Calothrix sp. NIES-4071]|nr:hypothetical protein NIES4071_109190 [Calothrix sp. NIES-4071]BAZ65182.1 hypothetical protein NIES4105_109150 [Calothrix sp. NIES-4105]